MDNVLQDSLNQVKQLCKKGFIDEALPILDRIIDLFPDKSGDLLYEKAGIEFENGRVKDALHDFFKCYERTGSQEAFSVLMAFSQGTESACKERYNENRKLLMEYPFFYGSLPDKSFTRVLWLDDSTVVYYDPQSSHISEVSIVAAETSFLSEESIMMVNTLSKEQIFRWMFSCKESWSVNGRIVPVFSYFDEANIDVFLQITDIKDLLAKKKLVFLVGMNSVEEYFSGTMVWFPNYVVGYGDESEKDNLSNTLVEIRRKKEEVMNKLVSESKIYYTEHSQDILDRIREKKPRIMFITSCFTTALQYHVRFCAKNLERIGASVLVLKEEKETDALGNYETVLAVDSFKPDVIFLIDHFRFEFGLMEFLKEIVCIGWIQDYMPGHMTKENYRKLTPRDVVMTHLFSKEVLEPLEGRYVIEAVTPADEDIYKPYPITVEEKDRYACDICIVCHTSDVEAYIKETVIDLLNEGLLNVEEVVVPMFRDYFDLAYSGTIYYSADEFEAFITDHIRGRGPMWENKGMIDRLVEIFHIRYSPRVFRQVIADWLIAAGYENIKLWGNGWKTETKYAKYAMGPAQNGEVLSKILQTSKIVLGNNIASSGQTRVWETMLSGGFYMSNYIPIEHDWNDIRKFLKEEEEFVVFHDRQDLLEKVDFYLTHDDERQEMIKRGRMASLERMTYKGLMQRMLDELPEVLEEQGAYDS